MDSFLVDHSGLLEVRIGSVKMKPLILGHRGVMGIVPENTVASFKKAVKVGTDGEMAGLY